MANKTKKRNGLIEAAVDAAEELGAAATAFKESWDHVRKARENGAPVTRAAARMGRSASRVAAKAGRTVARAGKGTVQAAKRMMPGAKKKRSR